MTQRRVIYDFGANNGDDIPYYLLKADLVVAIEANPVLCGQMKRRFAREVEDNRVVIENCVVVERESASAVVPFYIHKVSHVLSQLPKPDEEDLDSFERLLLPARTACQIIRDYGYPHYVKLDIEHCDHVILRELFKNNIRPEYISAEAHTADVFFLMAGWGGYTLFKIVDGLTVQDVFSEVRVNGRYGSGVISFPPHSAGPFGEELPGRWLNSRDFFSLLIRQGLGWKDIHATSIPSPQRMGLPRYLLHVLKKRLVVNLKAVTRYLVANDK